MKSSDAQTFDVTLQEGTPYRQLVQRDDRPLPAAEEKRELERGAKSISERRHETAADRARRLSACQRRPDCSVRAWHELPDAFEFRLAGQGTLDHRNIFIIEAVPRHGYKPRSRTAKLFPSIKGRFWVPNKSTRS